MAAKPADELCAPADDPRLRPSEQLVSREGHEVGAGGDRVPREGLVGQREEAAGAEVVEQGQRRAGAPPPQARRWRDAR